MNIALCDRKLLQLKWSNGHSHIELTLCNRTASSQIQRIDSMDDTIILCTEAELIAMHERGEIDPNGYVLTVSDLFEVMCEYYGVDSHWSPNDVY